MANTYEHLDWAGLLARLVPDHAPLKIEKRGGAVIVTREWDEQNQVFVWTKTIRGGGPGQDLNFLADWETDLLRRSIRPPMQHCVRLVEQHFQNSPMPRGDNPIEQRQHRQSMVRTFDAGPTRARTAHTHAAE